jgi:signal transduction histidine kinase
VKDSWRAWTAPTLVAVIAVTLWFLGPHLLRSADGWAYLGWGLALAVLLVAVAAYRTRRDPAFLFIATGSAAFGSGWLTFAIAASSFTTAPDWLLPLGQFGVQLGSITLAICLAFTVPWRDRRGRPPLRVRTVLLAIALPLLAVSIGIAALSVRPTPDGLRALSALTVIVALVASARSIARAGWHAWIGGGSLAILLSSVGVWIAFASNADVSSGSYRGAFAWATLLPSMALVLILCGILAAQRADASRLRRASDRATEVMEGRAEIASIVAHDVRGPAGTIRSVAGSLRTSYGRLADADRLEFVGMIEQESLRLLRVADQMSLGLKADAATLPYTMTVRDVEGPVLQGLHAAEPGTREVRLDIDGDLRASVDTRWLAEAVRQGIENALKFSPSDAPIDLRVGAKDGSAVIEIQDAGPPIPPEMREQVFEKFCRWRPHGYEDVSGSGLGLFIVRTIARAHGGDAIVATAPGDTGTILEIHLPMEDTGDR